MTERCRRARACFANQSKIGRMENETAAFLRRHGFDVVQQLNVGPYNLDISLRELPVAVEVYLMRAGDFNGRPDIRTSPQHKRLKYLLRRGWFIVFLIGTGNNPLTIDLARVGDDLVTTLKRARTDKSTRGKYRVSWGHGKPPARCRYNFNGLPVVD